MSFSEWRDIKLGDIVDTISQKHKLDINKIILVNTSDVLDGKVLNHQYVSNKDLKGQFKKSFKKDDILYSEIRPKNRRFAFVDFDSSDYVASIKLMVLRRKNQDVIPQFLYQILKSDEVINKLQIIAESRSGTFPQITFTELSRLEIKLPPILEQKAIAHTLSCLDDKIEVNNHINKTLEEMAQAIFKSWFVDFEPFQDGEFKDSELGSIPKEWNVKTLGDNVKISTKSINPQNAASTIFEHYSIPAYDDCKMPVFETGIEIKSNKYIVSSTCFLVSKLNPSIKRIWKPYCITENAICSTEFIVYESINSKYTDFYYSLVNNTIFCDFIKSNVTGSTNSRQRAIPKTTLNFKYICPPEDEIMKFIDIVKPIYKKLQDNIIENQSLAKTRDILIPKLMSGEIRVPIEEVK